MGERRLFQWVESREQSFSALSKAPADISSILSGIGVESQPFPRVYVPGKGGSKTQKLRWILRALTGRLGLKDNSIYFYQHPQYMFESGRGAEVFQVLLKHAVHSVGSKIAVFVHDLEELRLWAESDKRVAASDTRQLKRMADVIVVHNYRMKEWVVSRGFDPRRVVTIDLFDYLVGDEQSSQLAQFDRSVILAGNLRPDKVGYLKYLPEINVQWNLYGKRFSEACISGSNINYYGCFSPEEVVAHLKKGFGLVWEGDSAETCTGALGEYSKYINRHKLSLYMAAGLPVVIWKNAGEARFVEKSGVGILIDSLYDLPVKLEALTKEQYNFMRSNAHEMSKRVRSGCFTKSAVLKIREVI